ncbi:MAG: GFA family protein [Lentisphaerae bacterium]|nr:GFA family protein [Lentisphaerota bacterium]
MTRGSCHCGAVRYESRGKALRFVNCHCPDCRKFSGSAFATVLAVESEGFEVVAGADHLVPHESSPGKRRYFCRTCGCHVFARADARPGMVMVRAGTLDDDPGLRPQCHIWVGAKAPWHGISDSLPQHEGGLPAGTGR